MDRIIFADHGLATPQPAAPVEQFVQALASLVATPECESRLAQFDNFPAPLYATSADGTLTYFNQACIEFAGRVPVVGEDQYCVSWKLRSGDGAPLAHDQCPMAVALREASPVRGIEAFAERPDGDQRRFRPFATPAVDGEGQLVGGVNLLVPTDGATCRKLSAMAEKCRRLAKWIDDEAASETLNHMAAECESQAAVLRLP